MQKFILMGASRGLGWATYKKLIQIYPAADFILSSRNISQRAGDVTNQTQLLAQDFSKPLSHDYLAKLQSFQPEVLIYFAGGGPYGLFQNKKWSDHLWSLQTSFLYPAEMLHAILKEPVGWLNLKKIVLIGSAIAENQPDPMASSYAAAKHALKGLVSTLQAEQKDLRFKIELFSPGYMQTDLLPAHSHPRLNDRAERPEIVAERLIEYIENKA